MMKKVNNKFLMALIYISASVLMVSCAGGGKPGKHHKSILTPSASGNPYEVMVVAEDNVWEGKCGRTLLDVLETPVPMLPQDEPTFHVSHITSANYNRVTHLFRNIIILQQNDHYTKPKMSVERNVFAEPQLIMTIQGPDLKELTEYVASSGKLIIQYISAEELNRYATDLEDKYNKPFYDKVKEMFGCEMHIPADIKKMKVGEDFIWASNDGLTTVQSICIYSYPYVSAKVFSKHSYIAIRDMFMKANIPGELDNQWMETNPDYVQLKDINSQGMYIQEARGLWQMKDDAMGGPFVAHSAVDTINGRIVVVEAFVYAPHKMKRSIIRRLEAALYTLRLPDALAAEQQENNKSETKE